MRLLYLGPLLRSETIFLDELLRDRVGTRKRRAFPDFFEFMLGIEYRFHVILSSINHHQIEMITDDVDDAFLILQRAADDGVKFFATRREKFNIVFPHSRAEDVRLCHIPFELVPSNIEFFQVVNGRLALPEPLEHPVGLRWVYTPDNFPIQLFLQPVGQHLLEFDTICILILLLRHRLSGQQSALALLLAPFIEDELFKLFHSPILAPLLFPSTKLFDRPLRPKGTMLR